MGTIKLFNGRNNFLSSYFIQIPYYIFLGCSRQRDASAAAKAFEMEAGNRLGLGRGGLLTPTSPFTMNPLSTPQMEKTMSIVPAEFSLGPSAMERAGWTQSIQDVGAPLSPFHYQLRKVSFASRTLCQAYSQLITNRDGEFHILKRRYMSSSGLIYTAG